MNCQLVHRPARYADPQASASILPLMENTHPATLRRPPSQMMLQSCCWPSSIEDLQADAVGPPPPAAAANPPHASAAAKVEELIGLVDEGRSRPGRKEWNDAERTVSWRAWHRACRTTHQHRHARIHRPCR